VRVLSGNGSVPERELSRKITRSHVCTTTISCGDIMAKPLKTKVLVEKNKFDAVLSQLIKGNPVPMKEIKTTGKRRSGQLIQKRSES
jgi:hypothetical protein